jgi:hypothetical protein
VGLSSRRSTPRKVTIREHYRYQCARDTPPSTAKAKQPSQVQRPSYSYLCGDHRSSKPPRKAVAFRQSHCILIRLVPERRVRCIVSTSVDRLDGIDGAGPRRQAVIRQGVFRHLFGYFGDTRSRRSRIWTATAADRVRLPRSRLAPAAPIIPGGNLAVLFSTRWTGGGFSACHPCSDPES